MRSNPCNFRAHQTDWQPGSSCRQENSRHSSCLSQRLAVENHPEA